MNTSMNFTRRQFLQAVSAGGAVVAGKLWVPGEKAIFLPPAQGWRPDCGLFHGKWQQKRQQLLEGVMRGQISEAMYEWEMARIFEQGWAKGWSLGST